MPVDFSLQRVDTLSEDEGISPDKLNEFDRNIRAVFEFLNSVLTDTGNPTPLCDRKMVQAGLEMLSDQFTELLTFIESRRKQKPHTTELDGEKSDGERLMALKDQLILAKGILGDVQHDDLLTEVAELQDALDEAEEEIKDKEIRLNALTTERNELFGLKQECQSVQAELEKSWGTIKTLKDALEEAKSKISAEVQRANESKDEAKIELQKLEEKHVVTLHGVRKDLERALADKHAAIDKALEQTCTIKSQAAEIKLLMQTQSKQKELKAEFEVCLAANHHKSLLTGCGQKLLDENQTLAAEKDELQDDVAKLQKQIEVRRFTTLWLAGF